MGAADKGAPLPQLSKLTKVVILYMSGEINYSPLFFLIISSEIDFGTSS
jgi:hypothetical protein